jgi:hypothetical protein
MTDDEAVAMHKALAAYHADLARQAVLDIVHEYHDELAQRLALEVRRIPERRAAHERIDAHFRARQEDDR